MAAIVGLDVADLCCQATTLSNADLVLAADLRVMAVLELATRETLAELALLEVCDGVLAKRYVLGEEVVEVVREKRVVDTASETERRQEEESGQEASETATASRLGWGSCSELGASRSDRSRRRRGGADSLGGGRDSGNADGSGINWRSGSLSAELRRLRNVTVGILAACAGQYGLIWSTDVGKSSLS